MKKDFIKKIGVMCLAFVMFMFTLQVVANAEMLATTIKWNGQTKEAANFAYMDCNNYVSMPITITAPGVITKVEVLGGEGVEVSNREFNFPYANQQTSVVISPKGRLTSSDVTSFNLAVKISYVDSNHNFVTADNSLTVQNKIDEAAPLTPQDREFKEDKHDGFTQDEYKKRIDENGDYDPTNQPNNGNVKREADQIKKDNDTERREIQAKKEAEKEKEKNNQDADGDGLTDIQNTTYGDPDDLERVLDPENGIGKVVFDFAKAVAMIVLFISVIFIGINLMQARGNGEQRSSTMTGFMYVALGCIILMVVMELYTFVKGAVGDPESEIDKLNVSIVGEE